MTMSDEVWRLVVGYEGLYEVSDHGNVRRVGRAAKTGNGRGGGARIGLVLKPQPTRAGYLATMLWRDGKPKRFQIHSLVAAAFIGPRPDSMDVNHITGVKTDNRHVNLEYVTRSENNRHAYSAGLKTVTPTMVEHARQMGLANKGAIPWNRK